MGGLQGASWSMSREPVSTGPNLAWQLASIVAYLAMLTMNALANILPLFGRTTGEVSDGFPSLFTPAGYTFAVWGVVYLLLLAFAIYQALPGTRLDKRLAVARPLFVLSCAFNIAWLVSWHALAIGLSELFIVGLLLTLIVLYVRVGLWRGAAPAAERWLLHVPFAIYLGWVSVATIANTAILLLDLGFDGGANAPAITIAMVLVATALGLLAVVTRRDWAYALVVAWGLGGVAAARSGTSSSVGSAALVCTIILAVVAVVGFVGRVVDKAVVAPEGH